MVGDGGEQLVESIDGGKHIHAFNTDSQRRSVQSQARKVTPHFLGTVSSDRGEEENFHPDVAAHSSGLDPSQSSFIEPDSWTDFPRPNEGCKDQFLHRTLILRNLHAKGARCTLISAMI